MQRIMHIALRGATHGTMRRMHHAVHAPMAQAYPLLVLLCLSILPLLLAIANAAVKAVTGKALFLGRIDTYDPRGPSSSVRARPVHLDRMCTARTLFACTAHRLHMHSSLARCDPRAMHCACHCACHRTCHCTGHPQAQRAGDLRRRPDEPEGRADRLALWRSVGALLERTAAGSAAASRCGCTLQCTVQCAMQCTSALILGPDLPPAGAGCVTPCITPRITPCISPHAPHAVRRAGCTSLLRSACCTADCTRGRASCHQLRDCCPAAGGCRDRSASSAASCGAHGEQGQEEQIHQARGEEAQGPRNEGHEELACGLKMATRALQGFQILCTVRLYRQGSSQYMIKARSFSFSTFPTCEEWDEITALKNNNINWVPPLYRVAPAPGPSC